MRIVRLIASLVTAVSFPMIGVAAEKIMFVTSVSGLGDLSTWADAGGETGIQAADTICRARATAASLSSPSSFIAWISDATDDAYCRAHGLTGKKSANCGQAVLPTGAGPWVRTDGHPVGRTLEHMLWPELETYVPVDLDEDGAYVAYAQQYYFTNTDLDGTFRGSNTGCADWTSAAPIQTRSGAVHASGSWWTDALAVFCDDSHRLLCLQPGPGDPAPLPPQGGAPVFLTSAIGPGDLGSWPEAGGAAGLDAGDAICRNVAMTGGLGMWWAYKAWLSTSTENASGRFSYGGPWITLDGVLVAATTADLTDASIATSINVTEDGSYTTGWGAWTGTTRWGTADIDTCDGWTDGAGLYDGMTGTTGLTNYWWTERSTYDCSWNNRLQCFGQVEFLFADSFELGSTANWALATNE